MAMGNSISQMEIILKAYLSKGNPMVEESTVGRMEYLTRVNSRRDFAKDLE